MSRYSILLGKEARQKKESTSPKFIYRKIIVGGRGSGKTPSIITEIKIAEKLGISPMTIFPMHHNFIHDMRHWLNGINCSIQTLDKEKLYTLSFNKAIFFDDLQIKLLPEIIDFICASHIERVAISCDLMAFMNFIGKYTLYWKYIRDNEDWKIVQLNDKRSI